MYLFSPDDGFDFYSSILDFGVQEEGLVNSMCVAVRSLDSARLLRGAVERKPILRDRIWESRMDGEKWVPGIKDLAELRSSLPLGCMSVEKGALRVLPRSSLLYVYSKDGLEKGNRAKSDELIAGAYPKNKTPYLAVASDKLLVPLRSYLSPETVSRLERDGAELAVVAEVVNSEGDTVRVLTQIKASDAVGSSRISPGGAILEIYAVVSPHEAAHIAESKVQMENGGNLNVCW